MKAAQRDAKREKAKAVNDAIQLALGMAREKLNLPEPVKPGRRVHVYKGTIPVAPGQSHMRKLNRGRSRVR